MARRGGRCSAAAGRPRGQTAGRSEGHRPASRTTSSLRLPAAPASLSAQASQLGRSEHAVHLKAFTASGCSCVRTIESGATSIFSDIWDPNLRDPIGLAGFRSAEHGKSWYRVWGLRKEKQRTPDQLAIHAAPRARSSSRGLRSAAPRARACARGGRAARSLALRLQLASQLSRVPPVTLSEPRSAVLAALLGYLATMGPSARAVVVLLRHSCALAAGALLILQLAAPVAGHGAIVSPRSRNSIDYLVPITGPSNPPLRMAARTLNTTGQSRVTLSLR